MHFYNHSTKENFRSVPPRRIVSLVPSQTELLFSLGLDQEVVGITKFCVHPEEWFRNKQRIGGTKNINIEKILSLQTDLIIANKEENIKEQVEELAAHVSVYVSDIHTIDDAVSMINEIGEITGTISKAASITEEIQRQFNDLTKELPATHMRCAYLIWKDPFMTIGNDTFIHNMLWHCGFENAFGHLTRYPEISIGDLTARNCDFIFLSSEPYPFKERHITELQNELPEARIILVDGEMFSWYGSRLLETPGYFKKLIPYATNS